MKHHRAKNQKLKAEALRYDSGMIAKTALADAVKEAASERGPALCGGHHWHLCVWNAEGQEASLTFTSQMRALIPD